jgi:hypothetical protein
MCLVALNKGMQNYKDTSLDVIKNYTDIEEYEGLVKFDKALKSVSGVESPPKLLTNVETKVASVEELRANSWMIAGLSPEEFDRRRTPEYIEQELREWEERSAQFDAEMAELEKMLDDSKK